MAIPEGNTVAGAHAQSSAKPKESKFLKLSNGAIVRREDGAIMKTSAGEVVKNPVPNPALAAKLAAIAASRAAGAAAQSSPAPQVKVEQGVQKPVQVKVERPMMVAVAPKPAVQVKTEPPQLNQVKVEPVRSVVKRRVIPDDSDEEPIVPAARKRRIVPDGSSDEEPIRRSKPISRVTASTSSSSPSPSVVTKPQPPRRRVIKDDSSDSDAPIVRKRNKPVVQSDSDSDAPLRRPVRQVVKRERPSVSKPSRASITKAGYASDSDGEYVDKKANEVARVRRENRSRKQLLVAEVLKRWWYSSMPDWPPADYDYEPALKAAGIRHVEIKAFEEADSVVNGRKKAYQLSTFPGVFRDFEEKKYDLRPQEGIPSYANLMTFSEQKLNQLLAEALEKQLEELENSPFKYLCTQKIPAMRKLMEKAQKNARIKC